MKQMVSTTQTLAVATREAYGGDLRLAANNDMIPQESPASQVIAKLSDVRAVFAGKDNVNAIPPAERFEARKKIVEVDAALASLESKEGAKLSPEQLQKIKKE